MAVTPFRSLACPLDGAPLQCQGSAWCCPAGHSFDIASQGYANLLPVHKKRSLDPGDSKEMVAARRRFLNAGFYQPIAAAVSPQTFCVSSKVATSTQGGGFFASGEAGNSWKRRWRGAW